MPDYYDISVPLSSETPVYPGDPPVELRRLLDVARGDDFTLSALALSLHAGAHVDAPAHYVAGGASIDAVPPEVFLGPALVLDLTACARTIDLPALRTALAGAHAHPKAAENGAARLLLKTRNSALWRAYPGRFAPSWVGLDPAAARWLVAQGARLVGIDYATIEPPPAAAARTTFDTHRTLLGAGVVILEGIDLSAVPAGSYDLVCLPLRVVGAEAAPARVLLREREGRPPGPPNPGGEDAAPRPGG